MITILANGTAILEDGTVVPVVAWIDNNGDECGFEDAAAAVYGSEQRGFSYSKLSAENKIIWQ